MKDYEHIFESIKESKNPEEINDLLIELAQNPKEKFFTIIDLLIENLDVKILEKIKINLVYLIGELSKIKSLDDKYLSFLEETYYKSDRWIRKETITAFKKATNKRELSDVIIELIGKALIEDYFPIRKTSLKALLKINILNDNIMQRIIIILDSNEAEIIDYCSRILKKQIINETALFNFLDRLEIFKLLKKNTIRSLLIIYFDSLINLEIFRDLISKSTWNSDFKDIFLKEIDIFEKLLLSRI